MSRTKIAFIGNSLKSMVNFRGEVINYLSRKNYEVYVFTPKDTDYCFDNNIKYIEFGNINRKISVFSFLSSVIMLRKLLLSNNFLPNSHILAYSPLIILIAVFSNFGLKIKLNIFFIGLGSLFINKKYYVLRFLFTFILRISKNLNNIICLNNSDAKIISNYIGINNIKILNGEGINVDFYKSISLLPSTKRRFIFISRPLIDKGALIFLESIKNLKKIQNFKNYDNKVDFAIFGFDSNSINSDLPISYFEDCTKLNIKLYGYIDNYFTYLTKNDILVLPSKREGMSRVCMEMHELGIPVIGSDVPGINNIYNNSTGILIKNLNPLDFQIQCLTFYPLMN